MQAIYDALKDLDESARGRLLAWAASKFEIQSPTFQDSGIVGGTAATQNGSESQQAYGDIGDLFDAAQPHDGPTRAVVAGYWFQEVDGRDGWRGGDVNDVLKNLGHPLANVTKTLGSLQSRKPALVMQVAKSGRSAQARKTYKLTAAGIREVQQMLARSALEPA